MNNKQTLDYKQLIQQLSNFCNEKRSGTMLIISNDNHSIRFVLENGIILACAYTMTQGKEALPLIKKIQSGSYSFVDGGFTGGMNVNESPLPDTSDIFVMLGQSNINSAINTSSNTNNLNVKQHIEYIEKGLSVSVGPMAEFICEEFIEDYGYPVSVANLINMVNNVASEIDNPDEKENFLQITLNKIRG